MLSKAVTAALLAVLLLWVGVSKLVDASGQHGEATDAAPPATAAPTPAAADMLPWMRQQPDHRALNERWGLPMGPSPQPPPEVLGHHIPRILHHIYLPNLAAFLKAAANANSTTREEWGHTCAQMHAWQGWEHFLWDEEAATRLVSKYYPAYLAMWRSVQSAVQRADMLKYFLMHSIGGMYMDLDAECWRPVDATLQGADIVLQGTGEGVTNGQFAGVPGHPIWKAAIDVVHAGWLQNPHQKGNSLAGPARMHQAFRTLGPQQRKGQADPWAGVHQLNGTVRVHAVRSWFLLCHYNEPDCFKEVSLKRAVGLMPLTTAAGMHRYSASWISGGNQYGLHSAQALLAAACPQPKPS